MFRFFVTEKRGNYFTLDKSKLQHIKVVRIAQKPFFCIYKAAFYLCELEGTKAKIIKKTSHNHEFQQPLILAVAIIDKKRFEWLLEKAIELGATMIIPVLSHNVSQLITPFKRRKKRFQLIIESAAQQSFRNIIPVLSEPQPFDQVTAYGVKNKYIAHELAPDKVPRSLPTNTLLLVGPEGGFTNAEIDLATRRGFQVVNLGKRILRSETAAINMLSKVVE